MKLDLVWFHVSETLFQGQLSVFRVGGQFANCYRTLLSRPLLLHPSEKLLPVRLMPLVILSSLYIIIIHEYPHAIQLSH